MSWENSYDSISQKKKKKKSAERNTYVFLMRKISVPSEVLEIKIKEMNQPLLFSKRICARASTPLKDTKMNQRAKL